MCDTCTKAETLYGLGSLLAMVVREHMHKPTLEQTRARDRALANLQDYLDSVDGFGPSDDSRYVLVMAFAADPNRWGPADPLGLTYASREQAEAEAERRGSSAASQAAGARYAVRVAT